MTDPQRRLEEITAYLAFGRAVIGDNPATALAWFNVALELDPAHVPTLRCVARALEHLGRAKEAFARYAEAAETGCPLAQVEVGSCYGLGFGVQQDDKTAVSYYELAAARGSMHGMRNLAIRLLNGRGVAKDEQRARALFERLVKMEHKDALLEEAHDLQYIHARAWSELGWLTEPADSYTALDHYRRSAEIGDSPSGTYNYALLLLKLSQDPKDERVAVKLLHKVAATEPTCMQTLRLLAACYLKGRGVQRDPSKAAELVAQADKLKETT